MFHWPCKVSVVLNLQKKILFGQKKVLNFSIQNDQFLVLEHDLDRSDVFQKKVAQLFFHKIKFLLNSYRGGRVILFRSEF